MADRNVLRSKLRTPKKESGWDDMLARPSDFTVFPSYEQLLNTPSPGRRKAGNAGPVQPSPSPHKSGYFLRTPSPPKRSHAAASSRDNPPQGQSKRGPTGTPSPHKAGAGMDLFGNRSLLDGLAVPEWDTFLDNLFFGLGNDDLEGLTKSPRGQAFLQSSPLKQTSPSVSPLKSPLLTSSPKFSTNSPSELMKTPAVARSRPLTRQRKLFLQSPERQVEPEPNAWPAPLPFSSLDETASSMFSDDLEATTSIQSISTYLKQFDEEDNEEVVPPVGWTTHAGQHSTLTKADAKSSGKGKGKSSKSSKSKKSLLSPPSGSGLGPASTPGSASGSSGRKAKVEPQFTLLRPHTELHNNQICLRMAPKTPPNKMKISRDLSQIQTLPSKEQLKIVRHRFRESLNKAVEQVMEKEEKKKKKAGEQQQQQVLNDPALRSALQRPTVAAGQPVYISSLPTQYNAYGYTASKPQVKRRKK